MFAKERAIIEGALDAVVGVDRDGMITTWNCQSERVFGWTAAEAIGQQFAELVLPVHARDLSALGLTRASGMRQYSWNIRREHTGMHRSGREFPIEIAVTPIRHGDEVTFCAFIRDITTARTRSPRS